MNYLELSNHFEELLGEKIGDGCSRVVYLSRSGKYVFKLPRNHEGEGDNTIEANVSKKGYAKFCMDDYKYTTVPVAKSRLFLYKKFKVLCMELVKVIDRGDHDLHLWDEGGQTGINRKGQEVCYDYAWAENVN